MSIRQLATRPPVARVDSTTNVYYGVTVVDPYRWIEQADSPETRTWIEGQARAARAYLDQLPSRSELLERVRAASASGTTIQGLQASTGALYMFRRDETSEYARLVRFDTRTGEEAVLLDPSTLPNGPVALMEFAPSHDGRYVAYTGAAVGTEQTSLYVYDVAAGCHVDLQIMRTRFGAIAWLPGVAGFTYNQIPDHLASAGAYQDYAGSRIRLHILGTDCLQDPVVFGPGMQDDVKLAPYDVPMLEVSPDGRWLIVRIHHGTQPELSIFAAPTQALRDSVQGIQWTHVAQPDDAIVGYAVDGDSIFLRTHRDASRYRVVVTHLDAPDVSTAPTVVPSSRAVIEDLMTVNGVLVTRDLDGGLGRLRRHTEGRLTDVPVPFDGSIVGWTREPHTEQLYVVFQSWTVAPQLFRVDTSTGAIVNTGWLPDTPTAFRDLITEETLVRSVDGTDVPLSIICRRDLVRDGSNPTIVFTYGSYGIPAAPFFWPRLLPWFEHGGIYAIAHVRGGGEYGREWHEAGRGAKKQNSVDDTVACIEHLIAQGYTGSQHLALEGDSAGGIVAGNVLVQNPRLVSAVAMMVPVTNPLRLDQTPAGMLNAPEFGSPTTEVGFRALHAMDPYMHIQGDVAYPAVILSAGMNDPRTPVWQAAKFAARLQEASISGKPVLLRVDFNRAHARDSRLQGDEEQADVFAFLLTHLSD